MDHRYRCLITFVPNSIEVNREKHNEASDLIRKLMCLSAVCEVVPLRPNELVGDAKEFQAAVGSEATSELSRVRVCLNASREELERACAANSELRFALETSCDYLSEIAAATESKSLRKFVKKTRKLFSL